MAPACARCPIATAACEPTAQASGCRSQNCCMSDIVAPAADIASTALTLTFGAGCEPPLGNSTSTTLSQNASLKRKRMTPALFPAAFFAALDRER